MNRSFWSKRKVLLTGGAGFIGSNLAAHLVNLGSVVRVADNLERGKLDHLEPIRDTIEFVLLDLTESQACRQAVAGMEIIFHLASKVGGIDFYLRNPGEVILKNMLMDTLMLRETLRENTPYYCYASSAHVYPLELQLAPDAPPIKEEQAYPANPELSYGWAKLAAEKQIEYRIQEGGNLKASILRLVGAYGPNQDIDLQNGSAIPVFCRRAIEYPKTTFTIWGNGLETRSYCYIDDVIRGMLRSVEKLADYRLVGPINLGNEGRVAIGRLAEMIVDISGKPIPIAKDVSKPTTIYGQAVDCSKARELLDGWTPITTLRQGLEKTYRHIQDRLAH
jgi:GDP-D-mannose 3',5'-epimerase